MCVCVCTLYAICCICAPGLIEHLLRASSAVTAPGSPLSSVLARSNSSAHLSFFFFLLPYKSEQGNNLTAALQWNMKPSPVPQRLLPRAAGMFWKGKRGELDLQWRCAKDFIFPFTKLRGFELGSHGAPAWDYSIQACWRVKLKRWSRFKKVNQLLDARVKIICFKT